MPYRCMKSTTAFMYRAIVLSIQDICSLDEWKVICIDTIKTRFYYDTIIIKYTFFPFIIFYDIETRIFFYSFN